KTDRHALLLRFFDRKSLAEVGAALGLSEEASRKRVHRALEKLRSLLTKRGVVVPAVLLAAALTANAAPAAPATLTVSGLAAAGAATPPLVKGILTIMAWSKAKITLLTLGGLLLAGGGAVTTVFVVQHFWNNRVARTASAVAPAATPAAAVPEEMVMTMFDAPAPDADGFISLFN